MIRLSWTAILLAGFALMLVIGSCSDKSSGPDDNGNANQLVAINGVRYRGLMGASSFDQPLQFALTDANGDYIPNQQILVDPLEGDGNLSRSIVAGANGIATLPFTFSGSLPYATIRLYVPGFDTVEIEIRADAIMPGPGGQVGLIRFDDRYADVKAWLGEPDSEDGYPDIPNVRRIFANYESVRGIVVMLYDLDKNNTFYDTSSVYGVIVNGPYDGRTIGANPVGLDSSMTAVRARFGAPDYIAVAGTNEIEFGYEFWGLYGYASVVGSDTSVNELQFSEYVVRPDEIVPLDGIYSKGGVTNIMQDSFAVEDVNNVRIGNAEILLTRIEGDGTFAGTKFDTVITSPTTGIGIMAYNFNGQLGHATMRLTIPEVDTLDVYLRKSMLVPGSQGQYILFDEIYADVQNWIGAASASAGDGLLGTQYVYGSFPVTAPGVTVIFSDPGNTNTLTNASGVYGVSVMSPYTGSTRQGIKIGSTYTQLTTAYLSPSNLTTVGDTLQVTYDPQPARYDLLIGVSDTIVVRITTWEAP